MLMLPPSVRIYLATAPVDCRKSFDGLAALVRHVFGQDPLCGHIFVFRNRRGDHLRALVWDRSGFVLLANDWSRSLSLAPGPVGGLCGGDGGPGPARDAAGWGGSTERSVARLDGPHK